MTTTASNVGMTTTTSSVGMTTATLSKDKTTYVYQVSILITIVTVHPQFTLMIHTQILMIFL